MPSANGCDLKRAILYVRMSTNEQDHGGYSLALTLGRYSPGTTQSPAPTSTIRYTASRAMI
jgi:hypothetical protein